MPLPPALPEKEFFTMGEVERIAQVPAYTLRYWERTIGLLKPARRSSGHRRYTRRDLETILQIKDLLLRKRMTPAGARRALLERKRGLASPAGAPAALPQSAKLLREIRKDIQSLMRELK
ncbi:MAG: MerR family transcriptional regulator [Elusimicrobia bacterium]|nr:MerR family transcriptional regulator [Elusimicrobiota bacterium]MDE2425849.1 MerR family transcriptional regulator [Elusimicrobiota bacterium]